VAAAADHTIWVIDDMGVVRQHRLRDPDLAGDANR